MDRTALHEPFRSGANALAQRFKGNDYQLDPALSPIALVELGARRITSLARGVVRRRLGLRGGTPFLGKGVQLRNSGCIRVGNGVTIGRGCILDGLSHEGLILGDNVTIGAYAVIEVSGIITDLGLGCVIGDRSAVGAFSFIGAAGGVSIGEDVIMGQRVMFHSENHVYTDLTKPIREQGVTRKGIRIDGDCWVGSGVTFLDGAHVGHGCVIAAGSIVRGVVPALSVIAGAPAKVIRTRGPEAGEAKYEMNGLTKVDAVIARERDGGSLEGDFLQNERLS